MSSILKSLVRANPRVHQRVVALRARLFPDENAWLRRYLGLLTRSVDEPVFVKIGAHDGVTGDPCGDFFLLNHAWTGLLVEPVPYCVAKLRAAYGDSSRFKIDPGAAGSTSCRATFYYVSQDAEASLPDLPSWYDQLGSFDPQHIIKHLEGRLEPFIVSREVDVTPLDAILDRHGVTTVHFLQIDAEGHDLEVLKGLDFDIHAPLVILIEHKHLSPDDRSEVETLLVRRGYEVHDIGADFFAVHRSSPGLPEAPLGLGACRRYARRGPNAGRTSASWRRS